MKNFSKEEFVTLDEFTKNEFKTMSEYLTALTKTFEDAGIKNLFTEKELKKLLHLKIINIQKILLLQINLDLFSFI